MKEYVTTLFDDFFRYQLNMNELASWFKQNNLNTFQLVYTYILAYFNWDYITNPGQSKINNSVILHEFIKALAYKICLINGAL